MTFYKIGEVARLLGLTTQALRFYEQEGVVTPKKSENGTRYYDEDQLILLLSFKKYRQADFSVQDIVTHFKDDHLSGLREQILAQREALLKQSELLRRRADALDAFEKRLAYAQAHLDEPAICDRPPLRLLRPSLSELSAADMESRRSLDAFIAAMPDTRISFARALAPKSEKHFRLCADEAACAAWALPLEHTASLPSARGVRVIHRFACRGTTRPCRKSLRARRRRGMRCAWTASCSACISRRRQAKGKCFFTRRSICRFNRKFKRFFHDEINFFA